MVMRVESTETARRRKGVLSRGRHEKPSIAQPFTSVCLTRRAIECRTYLDPCGRFDNWEANTAESYAEQNRTVKEKDSYSFIIVHLINV